MPKIIKDAVVVEDNWIIIHDCEINNAEDLPSGDLIIAVSVWNKLQDALSQRNVGVYLNSHESIDDIQGDIHTLPIIAINFPAFVDGRGYSLAHKLRAQKNYLGELRAIGDVLRDQLFYMKRCGFNSFAMRDDQNPEESIRHLNDFTHPYQAAIDNKEPLFQSR